MEEDDINEGNLLVQPVSECERTDVGVYLRN
jgi:hypothetical protein